MEKLVTPELTEEFAAVPYGDALLPRRPDRALESGRFHRVPVIQGANLDEMRSLLAQALVDHPIPDGRAYRARLGATFGASAAAVERRYPVGKYPTPALAWATLLTDRVWICPTQRGNRALAAHVPTYGYEFADRNAPVFGGFPPPAPGFPYGAAHGFELPYLFDLPTVTPFTAPQRELSERMTGYWTRFARTGDPNEPGAPRWPAFRGGAPLVQYLAPGTGHPPGERGRGPRLRVLGPAPGLSRTARHPVGEAGRAAKPAGRRNPPGGETRRAAKPAGRRNPPGGGHRARAPSPDARCRHPRPVGRGRRVPPHHHAPAPAPDPARRARARARYRIHPDAPHPPGWATNTAPSHRARPTGHRHRTGTPPPADRPPAPWSPHPGPVPARAVTATRRAVASPGAGRPAGLARGWRPSCASWSPHHRAGSGAGAARSRRPRTRASRRSARLGAGSCPTGRARTATSSPDGERLRRALCRCTMRECCWPRSPGCPARSPRRARGRGRRRCWPICSGRPVPARRRPSSPTWRGGCRRAGSGSAGASCGTPPPRPPSPP
ncbi:carboxylesterase family protein [Streptomyces stramineus]